MNPLAATVPGYPRCPATVASRASGLVTFPHLFSLLLRIIVHGRDRIASLDRHAAGPGFASAARAFGSSDVSTVITCLQRGIMRAVALYDRLARRAARGLDVPNIPGLHPRGPRQSAAAPRSAPAGWWRTAGLGYLPTPAEIDDEVRRRALGPMLADITLDLGVCADADPELWSDLDWTIVTCGTLTTSLFNEMRIRMGKVDLDVVTKTAALKRWRAAAAAAAAAEGAAAAEATEAAEGAVAGSTAVADATAVDEATVAVGEAAANEGAAAAEATAAALPPEPAPLAPLEPAPPAPAPLPINQRAAERRPVSSAPRAAAGRSGRSIQFETAPTMHWPVMPAYVEKIAATGAS